LNRLSCLAGRNWLTSQAGLNRLTCLARGLTRLTGRLTRLTGCMARQACLADRLTRLTCLVWVIRMELGDQRQGGLVADPDRALQFAGLLA
jgi:hypothetical protein